MSEATGQNTLLIQLTNQSARCALDGYPKVLFYDRSGRIPFAIREGGDQMITGNRPCPFSVGRSGRTFVAVNKYRCDLGTRRVATRLRLRAGSTSIQLRLAHSARQIGWCGDADPGSTVDVTPFEPTLADTQSH